MSNNTKKPKHAPAADATKSSPPVAKPAVETVEDAVVLSETPGTALAKAPDEPTQAVAVLPTAALLDAPVEGEAEAEGGYASIPYVGFRGTKSYTRIEQLDAAGVKPMEFYLYDKEVIKVGPPFELHLLRSFRSYKQINPKNELTGVSLVFNDKLKAAGYKESIDGLVLVVLRGGGSVSYAPALIQLRGAHAKALKLPKELYDTAANAEAWAKRSALHAASAPARNPGGRFITSIWTTQQDPIGDGLPYNLGQSTTRPTPTADVEAFNRFFDAEFATRIAPVLAAFERRTNMLRKIAEKLGNV